MTTSVLPDRHRHLTACRWLTGQARWSCWDRCGTDHPGGPVNLGHPNATVDVEALHATLVAETRRALELVGRTDGADRPALARVSARLALLVALVAQHVREDGLGVDLLTSLGTSSDPDHAAFGADLAAMADERLDLGLEITGIDRLRTAWQDDPTSRTRSALLEHLVHLQILLRDHLTQDQHRALGLAATAAPQAWAELRRRAADDLPGLGGRATSVADRESDLQALDELLSVAPRTPEAVLPLVIARARAGVDAVGRR